MVKPDNPSFRFKFGMGVKNFFLKNALYEGCSGFLACRKEDFFNVGQYPNLIVREHRKLILELKKNGKYYCLPKHVTTSMRRLENWGLFSSAWFWIKQFFIDKMGKLKESRYETIR